MSAIIAVLNKKGENAVPTAIAMLETLKTRNSKAFGIGTCKMTRTESTINMVEKQKIDSPMLVGIVVSQRNEHLPLTKLENAALAFSGRIYPKTPEESVKIAAETFREKREPAAKTLVQKFEGNFAFAVAEPKKLIAGRNEMGIHPLYYGENADLAVLASEHKAFWKTQIKQTRSFPLGHIAVMDRDGFNFIPVKTLTNSKPKKTSMQTAARKLQKLLQQSMKKRVIGSKEIAVAFSGGLDSAIIAFLAKNFGANVCLIHVSLEKQRETEHAKEVADKLGLPIHVYLYNEREVEKTIQKVVWITEEADPVKTSIAIPVYWTAERTSQMKIETLFTGSGADELFGGYKRYVEEYLEFGDEKTRQTMFNDVFKLHKTDLDRDLKICNFHNVELCLPFATYRMAEFATSLPVNLKIGHSENSLRKLVLRQVAENMGMPKLVTEKPKKAMQYTTGVSNALKKLAKKEGLSVAGYLNEVFQATLKEKGIR